MSDEQRIREFNAVALDPLRSVVIEACAGSGKTWLLVSRIVRLLLAGTKPSEILAITFTRKAAQEMQARLHEWLHLLATADDDVVKQFLRDREVGGDELGAVMSRARGLLEDFLTDQPGITVNTFHGWFLHLLKRAPLAAGVTGSANLIDRAAPLMDEAWDLFAERLQHDPDSPVAHALDRMFEIHGLANTRNLLTAFLLRRAEWWAYTKNMSQPVQDVLARMADEIQVGIDVEPADVLHGDDSFLRELGEYRGFLERNATATDLKLLRQLEAVTDASTSDKWFNCIWPVLMTANGELRKRSASKTGEGKLGNEGQQRFLSLHREIGERLRRVKATKVEQAVYRLNADGLLCGDALLEQYQSIKRDRGLIDYTDVEWRAWSLLNAGDYAEYMHYRLDARYRHILLDEFQDTNPLQWQTLKSWLEASVAAGSTPRVFLVGDPKQSIYRFRRAEPRLFDMARAYLREHYRAAVLEQNITRRNAPAIVSVVNSLFGGVIDQFPHHLPYLGTLTGRVETIPLFANDEENESTGRAWRNPLDVPAMDVVDRRRLREADEVASRIGDMVGRWLITIGGETRPLRYEDIYLLVRRRTHLEVYERALRRARIPYTSSRHGGLLDTLEARDLTSLLQFLVVPFSDIDLATALRSPVFAVSDEDLLAISASDGRTWWQRVIHLVTEKYASKAVVRAHELLAQWMGLVDLLPVHDLLDRIYFESDLVRRYEFAVPETMRAAVAANLRALMEQSLNMDSGRYPSLQGFLHELASMRGAADEDAPDEGVIVEGSDAVRILTVHGSKGLEAPVVWLLDANASRVRSDSFDVLVDWPPETEAPRHFSLFARKEERGERRANLFEMEAELASREDANLLYVAMTRAQQVLIASGVENSDRGESWHQRIRDAIDAGSVQVDLPILENRQGLMKASTPMRAENGKGLVALRQPLNVGTRTDNLIDPHRRRGTLLHGLLEKLVPPGDVVHRDHLRNMLGVTDVEFESLWQAARQIIDAPVLSRFFDPAKYVRAFNELAFVSDDGELRRVDRVVEFAESIYVLDYKTGDAVDSDQLERAASRYRKQLDDYCRAVASLMPGKPVRAALIFGGGALFEM